MEGCCSETGLVTDISGRTVHVWLMNAAKEELFTAEENELASLKLGSWLQVNSEDLRTRKISRFISVTKPPLKAWTHTLPNAHECLLIETRIVIPPVDWACDNEYEWFAYSIEFGRIGNFAHNKLLKVNRYNVKRDVVYKAVMLRLTPNNVLGGWVADNCGTLWTVPPQVLQTCDNQKPLKETPWHTSLSTSRWSIDESACCSNERVTTGGSMASKGAGFGISNDSMNGCVNEVLAPPTSSNDYVKIGAESAAYSGAEQDHCGHCYQHGVYLGVVIVREPQYSIIWGRVHGFVAVSATADLVLKPSDWVEYNCIETDTELGVPYLAIYCVLSRRRPLVAESHGHSIICHSVIHLPNGKKTCAGAGSTHFLMVCDVLGDVLVPDIPLVNRCIRKGELKAKVLINYDINEKWPCRLFAVFENATIRTINWEEANARNTEAVAESKQTNPEKTVANRRSKLTNAENKRPNAGGKQAVMESKQTYAINKEEDAESKQANIERKKVAVKINSCSNPDITLRKDDQPSTSAGGPQRTPEATGDLEKATGIRPGRAQYRTSQPVQKKMTARFDWLVQKRYTVGTRILTLPVTILVKQTPAYGILWHINRKLIIVPAEHMGSSSSELGVWMKAKVSPLQTDILDLPYRLITVGPVEKIPNKLLTRQVGNVVQARVFLEPGMESFVSEGGKSYLRRNSELGPVLIPHDRVPQNCQSKRFRAWVTFMSSGMAGEPIWLFTHRQRLIEVDEEGRDLPEQFDVPVRLTEETSSDEDAIEIDDDGSTEEEADTGSEEFHDCLPPSA